MNIVQTCEKTLWDGDNFLNDTTCESGYKGHLVHPSFPS